MLKKPEMRINTRKIKSFEVDDNGIKVRVIDGGITRKININLPYFSDFVIDRSEVGSWSIPQEFSYEGETEHFITSEGQYLSIYTIGEKDVFDYLEAYHDVEGKAPFWRRIWKHIIKKIKSKL